MNDDARDLVLRLTGCPAWSEQTYMLFSTEGQRASKAFMGMHGLPTPAVTVSGSASHFTYTLTLNAVSAECAHMGDHVDALVVLVSMFGRSPPLELMALATLLLAEGRVRIHP